MFEQQSEQIFSYLTTHGIYSNVEDIKVEIYQVVRQNSMFVVSANMVSDIYQQTHTLQLVEYVDENQQSVAIGVSAVNNRNNTIKPLIKYNLTGSKEGLFSYDTI